MSPPAVSLVMPAYNSARYIDANVGRVLDFFDRAGIDGEVVVADDGSTDGTADAIRRDDRVRVLRLEHGGKGAAVRAGMAAATGDIRAFTDGDLPYGMEPLPLAIAYIQERRYHAVIGDRTLPGSAYESTGLLRTIVSELASFAFRTLVTGGIYDTCGFKVFRGDVAAEVFRLTAIDGFAIDVELIYLLLKYRLDLKRSRFSSSATRRAPFASQAFGDIAAIRVNWARGRYRSPALIALLQAELRGRRRRGHAARRQPSADLADPPVIALAYLAIAVVLGDALASRWFRPATWFHRLQRLIAPRSSPGSRTSRRCCSTQDRGRAARRQPRLRLGNGARRDRDLSVGAAPPRCRPPATPDPCLGRHHARRDRAARDLDDDLHLR